MIHTENIKTNTAIVHYSECPLCSSKNIQLSIATEDYSISKEPFEIFGCGDCGFHFTQDAPAPEKIAPYYDSEGYLSHSDNKEGWFNQVYHIARRAMLRKKLRLIRRLTNGKRLLDVGSGTGYFLNHMQQNGYHVTGVEIDETVRNVTLKNFGIKVNPPEALLEGNLPHKVDVITLWHVLEHLYDLDGYMQSMHRQLDDNGVMLIAVPNHTSYDAQHYGKYWEAYDVPRHLWHFSPKTVSHLAEKNGFKVVDQKRLPLDPIYNSILSEKYQPRKLSFIFGAATGLISLLTSYFNPSRSTSPIYILKKK